MKLLIPFIFIVWVGFLCLWFLKESSDKVYVAFVILYIGSLILNWVIWGILTMKKIDDSLIKGLNFASVIGLILFIPFIIFLCFN